jgi:hypothetical protein
MTDKELAEIVSAIIKRGGKEADFLKTIFGIK